MQINFYCALNAKGESVILILNSELEFDNLPVHIKEKFEGIKSQVDDVNLSDLPSRWWLCTEGVSHLESKGYYCFAFVSDK